MEKSYDIKPEDRRYQEAEDQWFNNTNEGSQVQVDYCRNCSLASSCGIYKELNMAMGEDYPFWSEHFLKRRLTIEESSRNYQRRNPIPRSFIACDLFEKKDLAPQGEVEAR